MPDITRRTDRGAANYDVHLPHLQHNHRPFPGCPLALINDTRHLTPAPDRVILLTGFDPFGGDPLNPSWLIAQALHDLHNGQLRRCKAMGFGEEELDALKHPELVSMLVNATVSWCSVSVNRDVLKRLLSQMHDVEREIATVDRMLRLGASTEMVSKFYGLTHQEVALRRDILGLPKRKGRHPVLDEAQDVTLWERWKAGVTERHIALTDDMAMLALTMDLADAMSLPMSVIWSAIRNWIDQGLV